MSKLEDTSGATEDENLSKLTALMADMQVAMITTTDADGRMVSRPMALQKVEFDGGLWFFTKRNGRKIEHVRRQPRVNVALSSSSAWISLTGTAEVVEDTEKAKALWNAGISAWFPDGPEDPEIVLLKIHADGAEYWDTPGAAIVTAISLIKSRITGKPHRIEDVKINL